MSPAGDFTGADAVVRALEDEAIPYAFGIPGTHNIELYDRLASAEEVEPVLVTDEQSASFMADGLWRASGRLGCVNVVPGAGLTHAMSGIAEAFMDNVPMLVLGCGIRRDIGMGYQLHDVDQLAMARPITKGTFRPTRGEDIYPLIRRACALARSGAPGPVMVEIPANLYLRPRHDPGEAPAAGPTGVPGPPPPATWEPDLERAVALLLRTPRPLLYLGFGAAGAGPDLVRLAELLESPVTTTLQGKGVFPESHPLALWPGFGDAAPRFARRIANECGATLAIGCRFSEVGTGSYGARPPDPLVHVDIDPAVVGRNYPAVVGVVADASALVAKLVEQLEVAGRDAGSPDLELRRAICEGRERVRAEALQPTGAGGVTPARLLEALQERLGPEAVFATDSGNGTFLAAESLRLERPNRFLAPVDFSCMGYAVPAGIGAALGCPEAPVAALVGDGAFLMTGLEMLTARQLGLRVAFLVLRDRELAQISQFQDTVFARRVCSMLPDYELEALCRGMGLECLELGADEHIERVVETVGCRLEEGTPVAVDVTIDYSRKTHFTRGVVRTNLGRLPWSDRLRVIARAVGRRLTG
jgi:acetolactate synthase-1/2/3 large subunit